MRRARITFSRSKQVTASDVPVFTAVSNAGGTMLVLRLPGYPLIGVDRTALLW
jgi:hypothetical protein